MRNKLKKNDTLIMISEDGTELVDMPSKNKNCPCNSRIKYKNCCYPKDLDRTRAFIDKEPVVVQTTAAKESSSKGILIL